MKALAFIGACLLASTVLSRAHAAEDCSQRLVKDPRILWRNFPEIDRKPPNLFESELAPLLSVHMERLPMGMNEEEAAFYQGVFAFLRDHARVYRRIREVEADLNKNSLSDPAARLHAVFARYESRYGFRVATVTERLSDSDWLAMIARGYVPHDLSGREIGLQLGPGLGAKPGHWIHGVHSHRLQWHLVLREVEANPQAFGSPKNILALYKRMGDLGWTRALDWSHTGLVEDGEPMTTLNLYFQLFDTHENNPSSPGYFYEYREYWPDLPLNG